MVYSRVLEIFLGAIAAFGGRLAAAWGGLGNTVFLERLVPDMFLNIILFLPIRSYQTQVSQKDTAKIQQEAHDDS